MYTLGIETSCDETSCAVLNNYRILSNVTRSSLREHKKYGGVVPEIATRAHLAHIDAVTALALTQAGRQLEDIGLIAVAYKPGLIGALVVGLNFAKALSLALRKPFIGVDHLHAHLFACFLGRTRRPRFPFLGVVISGGHTELYYVKDFNAIKLIGSTRDDACGEALDKVAMAYGLGYPGGPAIDKIFDARYQNDFRFRCGRSGLSLSFSGIKTALIYKKNELTSQGVFDARAKRRLLSSFQFSVMETIIATVLEAAAVYKVRRVVLGGGVLANSYLRRRLQEEQRKDLGFFLPAAELAQDNAAPVAGLGFYLYNTKGSSHSYRLSARAS